MPLLTIFLLLAACLPIAWPESPFGLTHRESILASALAVIVPLTIAFTLRTWVVLSLRRDRMRRIEVGRAYLRLRTLLFYFNLACVILTILALGWGDTAKSLGIITLHGRPVQAPLAELLVPLPYFLILFGAWFIYYDAERALHQASLNLFRPFCSRGAYILENARQMVLFLMPVGLCVASQSVVRMWPESGRTVEFSIGLTLAAIVFMILMPLFIRRLLGLVPLPESPTRERLLGLSQRLRFRFSDLLLWPSRAGMANALIIGLVPRIRFVIFTDRIFEEMPPEQVDAILGHEAGHALHGHIRYYLIFFLLSITAIGAVLTLASPWLDNHFTEAVHYDLLLLVVVSLYLFIVFGHLSRRCERQADVHGAWAISCGDPNCTGHSEETIFPHGRWTLCPTGLRIMSETLERVHLLNGYGLESSGGLFRRTYEWARAWMHGPIPNRAAYLLSLIGQPQRERRLQRNIAILRWGLLLGLGAVIVICGEIIGWANLARAM